MDKILQKLFRIGISVETSPQTERKVVLLNKITWFFLLLGLPIVAFILISDKLHPNIGVYISLLWLSYFLPLLFTYKGLFNATGYFLYFGGLIATASGTILLGKESYIHFLLLLVSGLPFVFFDRNWKNRRLWLALVSFPVWAFLEYWGSFNEPMVQISENALNTIGVAYGFGILMFSIFISYNFTKSAEKFGTKIKNQRDILTEKNARLEQFSYLATHDLKTPLGNIEGFLTLL